MSGQYDVCEKHDCLKIHPEDIKYFKQMNNFDFEYYLSTNNDLEPIFGLDYELLWKHFNSRGLNEHRLYRFKMPNLREKFDYEYYIRHNNDVAALMDNNSAQLKGYDWLWHHWTNHGIKELREHRFSLNKYYYINEFYCMCD